jgi:ankyrin repeat protein
MNAKARRPVSKSQLLTLIKGLDWRSAKAALEENVGLLEYRDNRGRNLLHVCCGIEIGTRGLRAADSIKMARVLLDASLDINREAFTEGEWKATPLWYAVSRGKNLELARYLLDRGAGPEHCMWAAAFNNSPAAVRLLVRGGAVVDARGGETPFMFAVKWSHFEAAKALLDAGANVNVQDRLGKTALHYMLKKRSDPKHVRMLLEHGARLDLADRDGITPGGVLSRMRGPEYQKLAKKQSRDNRR